MLTAIDQIANQNHLQMIKAAVPYLRPQEQRFIAVCAKLLELQNIMAFFSENRADISACSMEQENADTTDILNDIKNYCDPSEQEIIDRCLTMFSTLEMYLAAVRSPEQMQDYMGNSSGGVL